MHKNNYMELTKVHKAEQARDTHVTELPNSVWMHKHAKTGRTSREII